MVNPFLFSYRTSHPVHRAGGQQARSDYRQHLAPGTGRVRRRAIYRTLHLTSPCLLRLHLRYPDRIHLGASGNVRD
jgi:hypothetical protein